MNAAFSKLAAFRAYCKASSLLRRCFSSQVAYSHARLFKTLASSGFNAIYFL